MESFLPPLPGPATAPLPANKAMISFLLSPPRCPLCLQCKCVTVASVDTNGAHSMNFVLHLEHLSSDPKTNESCGRAPH